MGLPDQVAEKQKKIEEFEEGLKKPAPAEEEVQSVEDDPEPKQKQSSKENDAKYWQERCNVVIGKYNAEVLSCKKENENLKAQVKALQDLLAKPEKLISDEDREHFGDDYADLIEAAVKKAREADQARIQKLEMQLEKSEAEPVTSNVDQEYYESIAAIIPNWAEINDSEGFNRFLMQKEPMSGRTYQALVMEADRARDAQRVIHFFKLYLDKSNRQHERVVMPPARVTPDTPTERFFTSQEVDSFYKSVKAGTYQGDPHAMEQEIAKASREGRIR